jgi:hypothetical protein
MDHTEEVISNIDQSVEAMEASVNEAKDLL